MAAGFGDSNDIKITVSLDTQDAIKSVEELQKSVQKTLGEYSSQLQDVAKASRQISAGRIAEIRAQGKAEVALTREKNQVALAQIKQEAEADANKTKLALANIKTRQSVEDSAAKLRIAQTRQEGENFRSEVSKQIVAAQTAAKEKSDLSKIQLANAQKVNQLETLQAKVSATLQIAEAKRVEKERLAAEQSRIRSAERALQAELKAEQRRIAEIEKSAKREAQLRDEALRKASQSSGQSLSDLFAKGTDFGAGKGLGGILNLLTKLNPELTSAASALFLVRSGFGAVTSVVSGAIGAVQKFREALDSTARAANQVEGLRTGFDTLQRSIGQDSIRSIVKLREATLGLISDTQLYQRTNQAVLLGVPTDLFNEAAGAAVKLGRAMGIDAASGLESLSLGLGRQSRLYLDNLGIIVSAEEAYRSFAQANGIVGRELDDNEKRAAFFAEALKKIKERADELPEPLNSVGTAFQRYQVAIDNVNQSTLEAFNRSPELASAYGQLATTTTEGTAASEGFALAQAKLGAKLLEIQNNFFSVKNAAKALIAELAGTTEPQVLNGFVEGLEASLVKTEELRLKIQEFKRDAEFLASIGLGGVSKVSASLEKELAKSSEAAAVSRARLAEFVDQLAKKEGELNKAYEENIATSQRYSEQLAGLDGSQVKLIGSLVALRDKSRDAAAGIKEQADAAKSALESQKTALENNIASIKQNIEFSKSFLGGLFYRQGNREADLSNLNAAEAALKFFVDYVATAREQVAAPIKLTVDLSQLEEAQARLPDLINRLTTQQLEGQGVIEVPGVSIGDLEPGLAKIEELRKQLNLGKITAEDYGAKFKSAFGEVGAAISNSNIGKLKKDLDNARAALSGTANAGVDDLQNLEQAQKAYDEAVKKGGGIQKEQEAQVEKLLKSRVAKTDEATKKIIALNNRASKEASTDLKRQEAEFEKFSRSINRALDAAIPKDIQKRLVDLFNSGKRGSQEFEKELKALGREMQKRKGDLGALQKEVGDLADFQAKNPGAVIVDTAEASKAIADLEEELKNSGIFNIQKLLGNETTGGFFGYDLPEADVEGEEAIAASVQQALSTAFQAGLDGFTKEDLPAIGAGIGSAVGAAIDVYLGGSGQVGSQIGGAIGAAIGSAIEKSIGSIKKQNQDKFISLFDELLDQGSFTAIIRDKLTQSFTDAAQSIEPIALDIQPFDFDEQKFESATGNFESYFQTLSSDIQATFNGVGLALGTLLGVSVDVAREIGNVLANNIGGSLQNLQVLIQLTGESLESLSDAIIDAFRKGKITIEEAYNSLMRLKNLFEKGIPGAVGAYAEAFDNFAAAVGGENGGGLQTLDSFRDIFAEAEEAGLSFGQSIDYIAQKFGLSSEQAQLLWRLFKENGIDSFEEIAALGDKKLLGLIFGLERIKDGAKDIIPLPEDDPVTKTPTRTPTRTGETEAQRRAKEAAQLLKQQKDDAYQLTLASQKYADIIAKVASGQLTELQAQKQVLALRNQIFKLVREQQKVEAAYQAELAKGAKASLQRLESLDEKRRSINKSLDDATKAADKNAQAFKDLDLKSVLPFIKDMNNLGVVATQTGVNLQANVDILIKGFLQGRLSIKQVNDEIKKTKDLLGPGIPKAVGAVSQAFKNLIDAGTQGGQFSSDAFGDIFAEFREKFKAEGSALREAQRQQLTANLDAANAAFNAATGPEATKKAKEALDLAKKSLDDFAALQPKPQLDDLRAELEKSFGKDQVDVFFRALGESGLRTFEDFEKAGADSVISILGRLQELGFKFGETSDDVKKINEKLREAEKKSNNGLDPLKEAIELVKQFNSGASKLPPAFNETGKAIDKLDGPLTKLKNDFSNVVEKLGQLGGNTFENTVVFNVRTVGDTTSQNLIDVIYGKGAGIGGDAGGSGPNQNSLNSALRRKITELERLKRSGQGGGSAANKLRDDIRKLRQRGAQ